MKECSPCSRNEGLDVLLELGTFGLELDDPFSNLRGLTLIIAVLLAIVDWVC